LPRRAKAIEVPLAPSLRETLEVENRCSLVNGFIYGGAIFGIPGYQQLGGQLNGIPVKLLNYMDDSNHFTIVVITTREAYIFLGSDWVPITPVYKVGTISCSGNDVVNGTGTAWLNNVTETSILVVNKVEYPIKTVVSDTQLILEGNGPVVTDVPYTIRCCFTVNYDNVYDSLDAVVLERAGVNWLIVGTNRDGMFHWNGTGVLTRMPGAAGIDLKPRLLTTFKNRLIAFAPNEAGLDYWHRYRWSTLADYDDWTSPGSGFEDIIGGAKASRIVAQVTTNKIVILETQDAYVVNYVGENDVFRASPVNFYTGAVAKEGHVRLDVGTLVINQENFYIYFEGSYSSNLIDKLATDRLEYNVNKGYQSCGERWGRYGIGLLTVPRIDTVPRILVVDLQGEPIAWWVSPLGVSALLAMYPFSPTPSWDSVQEAWDDHNLAWDTTTAESLGEILLIGTWDGAVYRASRVGDVDVGLVTVWETKPYIPQVATRVNEVRLQARGTGAIQLEYSVDYGETWTSLGARGLTPETKEISWFPNKWCDSFKIRITAPSFGLKITRPYIYIIERRQR